MYITWFSALNDLYKFKIHSESMQPFGEGHIHHTYLVETSVGKMILQKFNHAVFTEPEKISHNHLVLLSEIDRNKLSFQLPLPIPNKKGEVFTRIEDSLFRFTPFVNGTCINEVQDTKQAYLAAEAFAGFIESGKHISSDSFLEVIPGFNDLSLRYNQLQQAIKQTKRRLTSELDELISFYLNQKELVEEYEMWINKLPLRLTHNDTKINNLIFSEDLSTVNAVIDLDTLMAGYAFYDFGDLVRTVACTEHEHSTKWEKIGVDKRKYSALMEGFLEGGKGFLTDDEIASLPFGGKMMTCIMGFRFLADYLNGNIYYVIKYDEQNLHRAKNHMYLLKALEVMG